MVTPQFLPLGRHPASRLHHPSVEAALFADAHFPILASRSAGSAGSRYENPLPCPAQVTNENLLSVRLAAWTRESTTGKFSMHSRASWLSLQVPSGWQPRALLMWRHHHRKYQFLSEAPADRQWGGNRSHLRNSLFRCPLPLRHARQLETRVRHRVSRCPDRVNRIPRGRLRPRSR
jgi:hypothetical protein